MEKNILIIAITKNKYPNTDFSKDPYFFNEGFNFCFIDDKSRNYKLHHADESQKDDTEYLTSIRSSGILMIYDGDDAPDGLDIDLENMFKALGKALDQNLKICLWYHKSTSGEIEDKLTEYLPSDIHIIELDESSHQGGQNEVYTHIPKYLNNEISLEIILEKCYTEKSKERAFQYNLPSLFDKLNSIKYDESGKVKKNAALHDFITHRDKLVNQLYEE